MMKKMPPSDTRYAAAQAAQWHEAMKTAGPREKKQFVQWLLESRANIRNVMLLTALDEELRTLDSSIPGTANGADNVVPFRAGERSVAEITESVAAPTGPRRVLIWALAASIAALALGGLSLFPMSSWGWTDFRTSVGEQRVIQLDDGSTLNLNTRSHLQVRFTAGGRDIRLVDGEALFKVQHDPLRPFRVHISEMMVQALGTQFDVYRREHDTNVAVLEGSVRILREGVSAPAVGARTAVSISAPMPTITAGEEARINHDGTVIRQAVRDIDRVIAWHQRRLVFKEDKLSFIVGEFNRYNRKPQFHIDDEAVGERRYTGVFDATSPASFEELLRQEPDLVLEKRDNDIDIQPRPGR